MPDNWPVSSFSQNQFSPTSVQDMMGGLSERFGQMRGIPSMFNQGAPPTTLRGWMDNRPGMDRENKSLRDRPNFWDREDQPGNNNWLRGIADLFGGNLFGRNRAPSPTPTPDPTQPTTPGGMTNALANIRGFTDVNPNSNFGRLYG